MRTQLAQLRQSGTSTASILNSDKPWTVDLIVICNTTAGAANFSIFHDADGTTYDQSTALMYATSIPANTTIKWEPPAALANNNRLGNLAIQQGTSQAITCTLYGERQGERF